jgi:hypothetical protein
MDPNLPEELHQALFLYGYQKYREGLNKGLEELEKVRGWLTRQPDRKWQKEVRGWVDKLIKRYKKQINRMQKE